MVYSYDLGTALAPLKQKNIYMGDKTNDVRRYEGTNSYENILFHDVKPYAWLPDSDIGYTEATTIISKLQCIWLGKTHPNMNTDLPYCFQKADGEFVRYKYVEYAGKLSKVPEIIPGSKIVKPYVEPFDFNGCLECAKVALKNNDLDTLEELLKKLSENSNLRKDEILRLVGISKQGYYYRLKKQQN